MLFQLSSKKNVNITSCLFLQPQCCKANCNQLDRHAFVVFHVTSSVPLLFSTQIQSWFFSPLYSFFHPYSDPIRLCPNYIIETKRPSIPFNRSFLSVIFKKRHQQGWSLYKGHNSNTCHPFISTSLPTSGYEDVSSDARNKKKESVCMCER